MLVAESLQCADFARAAAPDARTRPLNALIVSVALDAALVELRVRASDVERVGVFPLGAHHGGMLAFGRADCGR